MTDVLLCVVVAILDGDTRGHESLAHRASKPSIQLACVKREQKGASVRGPTGVTREHAALRLETVRNPFL